MNALKKSSINGKYVNVTKLTEYLWWNSEVKDPEQENSVQNVCPTIHILRKGKVVLS